MIQHMTSLSPAAAPAALTLPDRETCWHAVQGRDRTPARWLRTRPLVAAGRGSYSLYLWHVPVFLVVGEEATALSEPVRCAVGVGVSAALAWASYTYVERPFMVWTVARAAQRRPRPADD